MPKKTSKSNDIPPAGVGSGIDRLPPCNPDAERGVIGAILLDPRLCDDVATIVRPQDFYLERNARIYRRLLEMNAAASGIDLTLLVENLRSSGELVEIGGEEYLAELMTSVQVTAHAVYYAKIVQQNAIRRQLIQTCEQILSKSYDPETQPKQLVSQAEEKIFAINDDRGAERIQPMHDLMQDVFHLIDARAEGKIGGVATGFIDLDRMLGGLHGSELVILAARPSMGKTALATNIADYVAVVTREPVLFFSLEMAKTELALRMLCARGRIPGMHLRGSLSRREQDNFAKAANELSEAPIYIDDTSAHTVTEIGAVARRLKRQVGLSLIIIDYLGLIEPDNQLDPRQEQVAKIARRLKGLARELNVPVLCLAQLNRMAEMTKDNRPRLSHLRESGAIEQDADVVMFVHREEYYHSKEEVQEKGLGGVAEVIVAKQRNGPVGDVKLAWVGKYTLFANLGEGEEPEAFSEFNNYDESGSEADDY